MTARRGEELDVELVICALIKYLVLEGCSKDLRTFLLEHKVATLSLEAFQELGAAYQCAHRPQEEERVSRLPEMEHPASAAVWKVSVEQARGALSAMTMAERRKYLQEQRLCFNCLKFGHQARQCRSDQRCGVCSKRHHTLLHTEEVREQSAKINPIISTVKASAQRQGVYLMTAMADVEGQQPGQRRQARLFLDPGAQASFVASALVSRINASRVGEAEVAVQGFGSPVQNLVMPIRELILIDNEGKRHKIQALERSELSMGISTIEREVAQKWEQRGIILSDVQNHARGADVEVLIGADYVNQFLVEKREIDREAAWKTVFGWVLSGPCASNASTGYTSGGKEVKVALIKTDIQELWELDQPPKQVGRLPAFPLRRIGNLYEVGLLWKGQDRPADNKRQAVAALRSLQKRLKNSGQVHAYEDILIREYKQLQAVEPESNSEQAGYYLPHHAVVRQEAVTTKMRVVFNAAAAQKGDKSLNDVIDPGPSLVPSLVGLLLRFREFRYAFQADIKKAFFTISVKEEDRRYLRFLWLDEQGHEQVWRLTRLPFGVNCSPFLLSVVLQHHLSKWEQKAAPAQDKEVLALLKDSFYVDDCLSSVSEKPQVISIREVSTQILQQAGMDLRKWRSNAFARDATELTAADKVLGLGWDSDADEIYVLPAGASNLEQEEVRTRRELLRYVAGQYDPLGLVCPVTITGKILLQEAWKEGKEWDKPLSEGLIARVEQWRSEVVKIGKLKIPRWIGARQQSPDSYVVHLFTDASEAAYGCCIYLEVGKESNLLFAKARVAPLKRQTLARLELQAAFFGTSCLEAVCDHVRLPIKEVNAWTDSLTVIHWVKKPPHHWPTWVANRVSAIQDGGRKYNMVWRHCPGLENPADIASRGATLQRVSNSQWLNGPAWLLCREDWPRTGAEGCEVAVVASACVNIQQANEDSWWEKYSEWSKVLRLVRRILQWNTSPTHDGKQLTDKAELCLVKIIQRANFSEELRCLQAGKPLSKTSKLHKFTPFIDSSGIMRVGGRLQLSAWEFSRKHVILLGKHHLTELLIRHYHQQRMHTGVEALLAYLCTRFWILRGRRLARSVKERCVTCRRFDAKTCAQVTGPLPKDRIQHHQPFGFCGLDYAGPLLARERDHAITKAWIALFTCGTTRAIHLEVVTTLELKDFLLAFRRFMARRGKPSRIISDNASTFKAAAKVLDLSWDFNPPGSPWFGGFYERLVKSIKDPLQKVLGQALVSTAELTTLVTEVESIVNQRPLTRLGDGMEEGPVTPAMLLGQLWGPEQADTHRLEWRDAQVDQRIRYVRQVSAHLKERWEQEYLAQLRLCHENRSRTAAPGELVYVGSDKIKRKQWRIGLVTRVFPGKDGLVRVVEVKIGQSKFLRSLPHIVPLEISCTLQHKPAAADEPSGNDKTGEPAKQSKLPELTENGKKIPRLVTTKTRTIRPPRRLDL